MERIQLVIDEDGELSVRGLPGGWRLECLDYQWGATLAAGHTERNEDVPGGLVEWDDDAPFKRYDVDRSTLPVGEEA